MELIQFLRDVLHGLDIPINKTDEEIADSIYFVLSDPPEKGETLSFEIHEFVDVHDQWRK